MITIEEAIEFLNTKIYVNRSIGLIGKQNEVAILSIQALQEKLDRENPKPLTLEQLKQMDGEPVWVEPIPRGLGAQREVNNFYGIIGKTQWDSPGRIIIVNSYSPCHEGYYENDYGKTWLAYDREPKEY